MTRDNILNATAELFFHQLREDTDFLSLVALLAMAFEFHSILGGKKRGAKKERKERQARIEDLEKELDRRREDWSVEESIMMRKESRIGVGNVVAKRVRALLWAHLLRVDLKDKELAIGMSSYTFDPGIISNSSRTTRCSQRNTAALDRHGQHLSCT